jgi:hypothetical protein
MTNQVFDVFLSIGGQLALAWEKAGLDEEVFPQLAQEALENANLPDRFKPQDLLDAVLHDRRLDTIQTVSAFGDLSLTLYRSTRFYIEALYWVNGTTSIHQHGFSGAFQLLSGESISGEHEFKTAHRVNGAFYIGDLELISSVHLRKGMIRTISSGARFIHSVFHLALPSVTLVVRTTSDPGALPQFDYRPPHLKLDPTRIDVSITKRIHAWNLMVNTAQKEQIQETLMGAVQQLPLDQVYWILRSFPLGALKGTLSHELLAIVEARPYGTKLLRSIECEKIDTKLASSRSRIQDEDTRLFVAMLLNLRKASVMAKYISNYYPHFAEPKMKIAEFIVQLWRAGVVNAPGLDAVPLQVVAGWIFDRSGTDVQEHSGIGKTLLQNPELHGFAA